MTNYECIEDLSIKSSLNYHPEIKLKTLFLHQRIDDILRQHLFNFHRSCIGGSCGKGTALVDTFDLDIMVFINIEGDTTVSNYIRQRRQTLKHLKRIVSNTFSIEGWFNMMAPYYSLCFTFDDIKVDLVVALNMLNDDVTESNCTNQQYDRIIDLIHCDKRRPAWKNAFELSSSISETAVEFVKNQSEFVRNLIILCKYWLHLYCRDIHFSGKSSTIELIAIKIGNDSKQTGHLGEAFGKFLYAMNNINRMRVKFLVEEKFVFFKYQLSIPFVIDPQNPYNNRLQRLKGNDMAKITQISLESLEDFILYDPNSNIHQLNSGIISKNLHCSKLFHVKIRNKSSLPKQGALSEGCSSKPFFISLIGSIIGVLVAFISILLILTFFLPEETNQNIHQSPRIITYTELLKISRGILMTKLSSSDDLRRLTRVHRLMELEINSTKKLFLGVTSTMRDIISKVDHIDSREGVFRIATKCNGTRCKYDNRQLPEVLEFKSKYINEAIDYLGSLDYSEIDDELRLLLFNSVRSLALEFIRWREVLIHKSRLKFPISKSDEMDKFSFQPLVFKEVRSIAKKISKKIRGECEYLFNWYSDRENTLFLIKNHLEWMKQSLKSDLRLKGLDILNKRFFVNLGTQLKY